MSKKLTSYKTPKTSKFVSNPPSRVRSRESLDYFADDNGKLSKLKKNDFAPSNSNLVNLNKEYTDKAYDIIQKSRKNLNFINEVSTSNQNKQDIEKNLKQILSDDNLEKKKIISLRIPNIIRETFNQKDQNTLKINTIIKFSLLPKKSLIIFNQTIHPYQHVYVNIIVIMICAFSLIILIYVYSQKDLHVSINEIAKNFTPSFDNRNFNRMCFGLCFLVLISYALNCHIINYEIATQIYNDILTILEDIKADDYENFLSEEKIISNFSAKYDIHFLVFEQEILPKVKSLSYKSKKIKIFQFNDHDIWKLK